MSNGPQLVHTIHNCNPTDDKPMGVYLREDSIIENVEFVGVRVYSPDRKVIFGGDAGVTIVKGYETLPFGEWDTPEEDEAWKHL